MVDAGGLLELFFDYRVIDWAGLDDLGAPRDPYWYGFDSFAVLRGHLLL